MAKSIGRYEIREELGRGGMSTVYLAYDPRLHRGVAVKLMDQQLAIDPAFSARFTREARTVAALEHSAIVTLYDFGEFEGWLYLVMPYMKGGSLKQQLARGRLSLRRSYGVVRRIGSALDKAHSQDIIHRDLKPGNILLDAEGEAYLSDFGIVKVAKGDTEYLTQTGQTIGTFAYMSPEQLMGEPIDGRSDLYALGIVLYEMLTGKHPYGDESTTDAAMAVAHTQKPVPDVTTDNPDLPPAFTEIVYKALAKRADDRYSTGRELAMAMYTALTAGSQAAQASTPATAPAQPAAQQPTPVAPAVEQSAIQEPLAQPSQEQLSPAVASPNSAMPLSPQASESSAEATETELPTAEQVKSAATPLPRWIMLSLGLVAIVTGAVSAYNHQLFVHDGFAVFYLLFVGLLIGGTLLTRPRDWRWRLAIALLAIVGFLSTFITYQIYSNYALQGAVIILVGVMQIIQGFRGAGIALAALGVASAAIGGLVILDTEIAVTGPLIVLCGIVAIVLTFVNFRRLSGAG